MSKLVVLLAKTRSISLTLLKLYQIAAMMLVLWVVLTFVPGDTSPFKFGGITYLCI